MFSARVVEAVDVFKKGYLDLAASLPVGVECQTGMIVSSHERFWFSGQNKTTRLMRGGQRLQPVLALETVVRTDGYHTLIRGLVTA